MRKRKRKPRPAENPEYQKLFKRLCDVLLENGIETRVEAGRFRGGICLVEGDKEILFINKKHSVDKQIALIITELKRLEAEDRPIPLPAELQVELEEWW